MSIIATAVKHLLAAGVTGEALIAAIAEMEAAAPAPVLVNAEPSKGALRMRAMRERSRHTASQSVTCDVSDARVTLCDTPPSPSPPPLLSPQTPQTTPPPLPHPDGFYACTRGRLIGWIVLAVIAEACRAKVAAVQPKARPAKARWPREMPPPPEVTDDQWAGLMAHRLAKRSPLTPRAYDLLTKKLANFASDIWPPGKIIDTIVERGWTSFEPSWLTNITDTDHGPRPRNDRPSGWASRPGMEGVEPAYLDD